jgi:4-hydroxythreonine-4-phosphate dehydrogenase
VTDARIGVTLGDPAGVGPEVVVRALAALPEVARRVVV